MPAADFMDAPLPPRPDVLSPLLAANTGALVYGPGGVGKSFFALGIAWAAATGGSFLGWQAPRPHRVLYVDGEMGAADLRERLALFGRPPATLKIFTPDLGGHALLLDLARLESQVRMMQGWNDPELVVLDSLSSLAGVRTGDTEGWGRLHAFLLRQKRFGRAMLVVHHANKRGAQRGSTHREDALDLVIALRRPRDWRPADGARFEIHFEKTRRLRGDAAEPVLAQLRTGDGTAHWHWTAGTGRLDRATALLKQGMAVKAMGATLGVSLATAYRLRDAARRQGLLIPLNPKETDR
jgi:putative DNA primase/helicase